MYALPTSKSSSCSGLILKLLTASKINPRRLIASLLAERDRERLAGVASQVVSSKLCAVVAHINTSSLGIWDCGKSETSTQFRLLSFYPVSARLFIEFEHGFSSRGCRPRGKRIIYFQDKQLYQVRTAAEL